MRIWFFLGIYIVTNFEDAYKLWKVDWHACIIFTDIFLINQWFCDKGICSVIKILTSCNI